METAHPHEPERLRLSGMEIDPHVVRLVPREMAQRFRLVAVGQEADTLILAMEDPLDVIATDTIAANTGYEVTPKQADAEDIASAIDKYYGDSIDIEQSIQSIVDIEIASIAAGDIDSEQLSIDPDDAPVIRLVNLILLQAIEERASDIHIEPREKSLAVQAEGRRHAEGDPAPAEEDAVGDHLTHQDPRGTGHSRAQAPSGR